MARCAQTPQEFINSVFPAVVGALASEDAEAICQKNNLSFVELVRPFCQLDSDAQIRDPVNPSVIVPVKKWKIRVIDIQSSRPPPALINKILGEVVSKSVSQVDLRSGLTIEEQSSARTPWFEAYRDCFFQLVQPLEHEFMRDYLACILVVSTKHPDPMHAFAALSARQNSIQNSAERQKASYHFFDQSTFKYYVLLHDVSEGDDSKAEKTFLSMKSVYGNHTCFLLQINSRKKMLPTATNATTSEPWSAYAYPFDDGTLNMEETDFDDTKDIPGPVVNQKDMDQKEQKILSELESIDKEIAERPEAPQRSLSFNDPLTSTHYDTLDEDETISDPLSSAAAEAQQQGKEKPQHSQVTPKLSQRSQKIEEYKRSLRQFSYNMVTSCTQPIRRMERGQCMTLVDQDKIKAFVYEFAVRGLLPHIEKLMRNLSEQILNRRGLHKSLFNVTKKWFGGNKTQGGTIGSSSSSANYQRDSVELQHRRLGDLSFLVQHYDLAYNSYHSAKREFNNDHAWLYFAGSLEMAAISAFLTPNNKNYPVHYFEACISTYLNTCRLPEYAARACLLSTETFKSRNRNLDAANEFIKLTNEDPDLRSALLLEQAAHCYLNNKPPMVRKYAFHMILAGHRYSKSAQRKHTLRCYINALQIYEDKGWHLAEDHVNFVIGRQSFNLGNLDDAHIALKCLLLYESQQPPSQQASHLREFLAVFKQYLETKKNNSKKFQLPELPLPNIKAQLTRCLTCYKGPITPPTPATNSPSINKRTRTVHAGNYTFQKNYSKEYTERWSQIEQKIVQHVTGGLPYPFKPFTPCLSSSTENKNPATVACKESFAFEIVFRNPLKIPLNLLNLTLLWQFTPDKTNDEEPEPFDNKENDCPETIEAETIQNFFLKPLEEKPACLRVCIKQPGQIQILGVKYTLSSVGVTSSLEETSKQELDEHQQAALNTVGVYGIQMMSIQGARLNNTKQQKAMKTYDIDKRLELQIVPSLPFLDVTMSNLPVTLLCGETQTSQFTFKNTGQTPMKNLHLICSCPQSFAFGSRKSDGDNNKQPSKYPVAEKGDSAQPSKMNIANLNNTFNGVLKIPVANDALQPGEEVMLDVAVYGALSPGVHEIYFLFYYEPLETVKKVPYRLLQQMIRIQTLSTLSITTSMQKSFAKETKTSSDTSTTQDHLFTMNIENRAQGSSTLRCVEFSLKQITCYSKLWNPKTLVKLPKESFFLRPGETCSLHLKASACQLDKDNDQIVVSQINLDDQDVEMSDQAMDLFLQSSYNKDAIDNSFAMILHWETFYIDESFSRNVIRGQSYVVCTQPISHWIKQQLLINNTEKELVAKQDPSTRIKQVSNSLILSPVDGINLSYHYNALYTHDFSQSSLCKIPVTITCCNMTSQDVKIELEAMDANEQFSDSGITTEPNSLCQILWSGRRKQTLSVPPNSSMSVILDLMTSIGLFEIQHLNAWLIKTNENGEDYMKKKY
uniref:Trafficking protein particle complex subunit 8 n=2 Tax=Clytia hemisphaerica TaxID=252671 RepID=A0A7M5V1Y5_9CNID